MRARVGPGGRVTIPKPLRDRLGIRAGDMLTIEERNGGVAISKATADHVDELYGVLRLRRRTDDLIREMRGADPGST